MEAARQREQVRVVAAQKKEEKTKGQDGASLSASKVVGKGVSKRKADRKDNRPSKKVSTTPWEGLPKKLSPPKPKHGVGKGLMTMSGLVTQELDHRLLTHKDYVVEMIGSIIKDKDVDPCIKQWTNELGSLGLFNLARVHTFIFSLYLFIFMLRA